MNVNIGNIIAMLIAFLSCATLEAYEASLKTRIIVGILLILALCFIQGDFNNINLW